MELKRRYLAELREATEAVESLVDLGRGGTLTLIHASRDEEFNNAVALREYLIAHPDEYVSGDTSKE